MPHKPPAADRLVIGRPVWERASGRRMTLTAVVDSPGPFRYVGSWAEGERRLTSTFRADELRVTAPSR